MSVLAPTLPQLGRIRAGDKQPIKGKRDIFRPNRLERFRLTSQNPVLLAKAVEAGYGDAVEEWPDAPEGRQWQLYCTVDRLPVSVPHLAAFSQYSEHWQAAECAYRCDGETLIRFVDLYETAQQRLKAKDIKEIPQWILDAHELDIIEGMPCPCAQFTELPPTVTRLNVYLPDLPGIGVWRLDTRGFYAGSELQGIALMLQEAALRGMWIDAELSITQRRKRSGGQTRVFPVIQLQPLDMSMRQVMQLRQARAPQLPEAQKQLPTADDVWGEPTNPTAYDPVTQTEYDKETGEAIPPEVGVQMTMETPQPPTDQAGRPV